MKVALIVYGSRGDVQPMLALATELMKKGNEVIFCASPENDNPEILYVDELSFEFLFPRLSAIIHHGGTGTRAYATRSGVPQAAFPFIADQFENRKQIVKLGLGPNTCDFRKMTAESISDAISEYIINDSYKKNAVILSNKLELVNGL